jgi:hypothetical protein
VTRPSFARDFPRVPELDALVDAFARGDYRRVRAGAPGLERSSTDDAVKRAARMLVERTAPDPLASVLLGLAAVLLATVASWWIVHGKAPPSSDPPPWTPPVERVR